MKCPKCGQEMIHINNQYICTVCGIVANESSPRQQVLGAIKKKMVNSQNVPIQEKYISPTALATQQKPQQNEIIHKINKNNIPQTVSSGVTLDQIIAEMAANQSKLKKEAEKIQDTNNTNNYIQGDLSVTGGEKVIPRTALQNVVQRDSQSQSDMSLVDQGQNQAVLQQPPMSQTANMSQQNIEASGVNPGVLQDTGDLMSQGQVTDFQTEPALTNDQTIYPSHQINPILFRILIVLLVVLVLIVIGYFIYANFSGVKGFLDNMVKYLGTSIFK